MSTISTSHHKICHKTHDNVLTMQIYLSDAQQTRRGLGEHNLNKPSQDLSQDRPDHQPICNKDFKGKLKNSQGIRSINCNSRPDFKHLRNELNEGYVLEVLGFRHVVAMVSINQIISNLQGKVMDGGYHPFMSQGL